MVRCVHVILRSSVDPDIHGFHVLIQYADSRYRLLDRQLYCLWVLELCELDCADVC